MKWLYLFIAIIAEVIGTSALKSTEGFTRLIPSIVVVTSYSLSFFFLSLTLKTLNIGVAYAIWSGLGITLILIIGHYFFKQPVDTAGLIGIILIIIGVAVINLFSKSVSH